MWKIQKVTDGGCIILNISGRIQAAELIELQKALSSEETARKRVELDLQNVRLVDQQAVTFFACCEANGARLRNCPSYIREWIDRERSGQNHRSTDEDLNLSCN